MKHYADARLRIKGEHPIRRALDAFMEGELVTLEGHHGLVTSVVIDGPNEAGVVLRHIGPQKCECPLYGR